MLCFAVLSARCHSAYFLSYAISCAPCVSRCIVWQTQKRTYAPSTVLPVCLNRRGPICTAGVAVWRRWQQPQRGGSSPTYTYNTTSRPAASSSPSLDASGSLDVSPVTGQELNPFLANTHTSLPAAAALRHAAGAAASGPVQSELLASTMLPVADVGTFAGGSGVAFGAATGAAATDLGGRSLFCKTGRSGSRSGVSGPQTPLEDASGGQCQIDLVGGEPVRIVDALSFELDQASSRGSADIARLWTQQPLPDRVRQHSKPGAAAASAVHKRTPSNVAAAAMPSAFGSQGSSPRQPLSPPTTADVMPPLATRGTTAQHDLLQHEPAGGAAAVPSASGAGADDADGASTENLIQRRALLAVLRVSFGLCSTPGRVTACRR